MGRRKVGPIRIHKKEIDLQTGVHHNWAQDIVGPITATFLEEIIRLLLDGYEVYLKDFGTFRLVTRKGRAVTTLKKGTFKKGESCGTTTVDVRNKHYIVFKKSIHLRERIKERLGKERVLHPKEPPHDT
jgi:nucleoid DNA-binding protein